MASSGARRWRGRLASAAVLTGLLLPFGSALWVGLAGGSTEAAQAATPKPKGSSWKIVRTVNFNGAALPEGCTAYTGKYTAGANAWISKDATAAKGKLNLTLEKRTTSGKVYSAGGIACLDWKQKYGRFEVLAKVPAGKGIDSNIALWPTDAKRKDWTGLEVLAPGPQTAYVTNGYSGKYERAAVPGTYAGAFHTYVIEWSPKQVRMTVDGKQIYYSTKSFNGARWFSILVSNGDALTGVPDASTTLPARLQIDRVKVWSYTGVPPKAQPTPTPTPSAAAGVPSPTPTAGATSATGQPGVSPTGASALRSVPVADRTPALAGGFWPWLLGGSLIAITVIVGLSLPAHRRARAEEPPQ